MPPRRSLSRATWSPEGKYAALIEGARLVVTDERGRVLRDLISHFAYPPDDPVWSPNGRWIAVEGGGHGGSIGIVPSSGGDWRAWRMLWATPDLSSGLDSPAWTPDSRHLAFTVYWSNSQALQSGIYTIGIDGTGFRLLVPEGTMPTYSPDGSRIAYVRRSEHVGAAGDIWVSDANGADPRRLTASDADARPVWSPRGRLIAFQRTVDGHSSIWAVRPDGSGERALVSSPRYNATLPSWRPPAPFHGGPRRPCP
jgi:Tol biopolymer transport system component